MNISIQLETRRAETSLLSTNTKFITFEFFPTLFTLRTHLGKLKNFIQSFFFILIYLVRKGGQFFRFSQISFQLSIVFSNFRLLLGLHLYLNGELYTV